ncbi:longitudinals lacking protein, isoforms A/B/D/L isoform X3 [Polyergus mexicanus]|uniref:longitudinals lacking protein, isoforms A/B/D/L isoform X3 n=1 Tax=Polyergus mexicanus TaxID=615972 RepID=UPI0038B4E0FF
MEDDQQFCLRWNNHQSTLIQNFDTLLESGTLVDCTLAAEGKTLKAHKVVLSACSPYFECLLSEHYDKHPVFILKDVKFKELKAMMDYMYRGEVNISQDQLAALLKAAESLQIKGLSESKTAGSSKTESRPQKTVSQPIARVSPSLDIPHASSGLTIEKNKVPRQSMAQGPVGDIPEDTASPQGSKRLCSREGSQSPTTRKRNRFRRRSLGEDNTIEMQDASNSSDMPQQMSVPALGITPVADEKVHADSTDSLGRSALMTQLTKPADEMLQLPLEKPEPNDNLIEPKSEYLEESEECVEDLTLDDDMNDLNDMEQDNNRAGPSHDPTQHPAGLGAWHVTGDRSNAGGVVGTLTGAGATGATDEMFLTPQEATAQQQRDSQGFFAGLGWSGDGSRRASRSANAAATTTSSSSSSSAATSDVPAPLTPQRRPRLHCPSRHSASRNNNHPGISGGGLAHHDRRHNCSRCGKSYKNAYILKRHLLYECGKAPSFSCPHCAFSSKYERNLKAHINHRHVDLQPALPGIAVGQRETRHQHGRE